MLEQELSEKVLSAFFVVYRALGYGFLEAGYANALVVELQRRGLSVKREAPIEVVFLGVPVRKYRIDLLVNDRMMIEVKSTKAMSEADERQLLNYLKASTVEIGYLVHFGPEPRFRRLIRPMTGKSPIAETMSLSCRPCSPC